MNEVSLAGTPTNTVPALVVTGARPEASAINCPSITRYAYPSPSRPNTAQWNTLLATTSLSLWSGTAPVSVTASQEAVTVASSALSASEKLTPCESIVCAADSVPFQRPPTENDDSA